VKGAGAIPDASGGNCGLPFVLEAIALASTKTQYQKLCVQQVPRFRSSSISASFWFVSLYKALLELVKFRLQGLLGSLAEVAADERVATAA